MPPLDFRGWVDVVVYRGAEMVPVRRFRVDNLVTNYGMARFLDLLVGNSSSYPNYIAVGDGTTAAAYADVALGNSVARVPIVTHVETTDVDGDGVDEGGGASGHALLLKTFISRNTGNSVGTYKEIGVFVGAAGNTCCARVVLSAANYITKDASTSITMTWHFTLTAA